jgi:hypothetical protein
MHLPLMPAPLPPPHPTPPRPQFLNTAVSSVIANAHLPRVKALVPLGNFFFRGQYPDLTPNWYKNVRQRPGFTGLAS